MILTNMISGMLRKEKCPQENGTKGFQHLVAMIFPGFEKAATRLQFPCAERFQNDEDVLADMETSIEDLACKWRYTSKIPNGLTSSPCQVARA